MQGLHQSINRDKGDRLIVYHHFFGVVGKWSLFHMFKSTMTPINNFGSDVFLQPVNYSVFLAYSHSFRSNIL